MARPLATVALQFFNCERTLDVALRSIQLQTLRDWELLLHDDGSVDGSREVVTRCGDPRFRLVSEEVRRGRATRINQAVEVARGRYFALMDGDDVAYPERLERQIAFLEAHPEIDLVGSPQLVFASGGRALGKRLVPNSHEEICAKPWSGFPLWQPTFVGKLEWFKQHHYDGRRLWAEDQDLLLRSRSVSRFANLPEILMGYREDAISLRRSWHNRLHLSASLWRQFCKEGRAARALCAVAAQALKGTADALAVASGLRYRVLRHRARPLSESEKTRWREVWALVMQEGPHGRPRARIAGAPLLGG